MKRRKAIHGLPVISLTAINSTTVPDRVIDAEVATQATVREPITDHLEHNSGCGQGSRTWVANRRDAPICNFTRKARRSDLAEWTPEQQQAAVNNLIRDYTSVSAKGPAASVLKTWEAMHRRMHSDGQPCFPLTAAKITKVAAAFKACGYRSFANYMSKAKEHHIQLYQEWGPDLALEARRAGRSVTRGIGPVTQRTPLDVDKLMESQAFDPVAWHPMTPDGPVGPYQLVILGTFFLLREAEASLLLTASVKLDTLAMTVTLKLPSSKTDAAAASVDRTWGCLCGTHQIEGCPFHQAEFHMKKLIRKFGSERVMQLPFFPTEDGGTVEKVKVVETFERLHERLNLPVLDEDGAKLLGGHSMRLAGARLLSSAGLHLYQVELMARWKSPMLIHYAQSAPLKRVTQEYETANDRLNTFKIIDEMRLQMQSLQQLVAAPGALEKFDQRVVSLERDLAALDSKTSQMIREEIELAKTRLFNKPSEYVRNGSSGVWHVNSVDGHLNPPSLWSTKCGWKFANSQFTRSNCIPDKGSLKCDKCWQLHRSKSPSASDSDSESSS